MRALALTQPGSAVLRDVPEPQPAPGELLLRVEMVGLCGTDLNSFRGRNPLVTYRRILGHRIGATVLAGNQQVPAGTRVAVSPYTSCGACSSCRRGRQNACRGNQTFGVQRDGALAQLLAVPAAKVYPSATLSLQELALVEPLTVGAHAIARGRVTAADTVAVIGCGGIGLGAIAASAFRGTRTIAIDLDDAKLETARLAGATDLIHSTRGPMRQSLRELTQGNGPNVIIEAIGLADTFRSPSRRSPSPAASSTSAAPRTTSAMRLGSSSRRSSTSSGSRNALPEDFRGVMAMLESGRFPVDAAITATLPLAQGPAILAEWPANPAAFTKIMIDLTSSS